MCELPLPEIGGDRGSLNFFGPRDQDRHSHLFTFINFLFVLKTFTEHLIRARHHDKHKVYEGK